MSTPLTEADKRLLNESLAKPHRSTPSKRDLSAPLYDVEAILQSGDKLWAAQERLARIKSKLCQ